jgi:hypothetical protein
LTEPKGEELHRTPHFLPDGRALLFTLSRPGLPDQVAVLTMADGAVKTLTEGRAPRFVGPGHLVFDRDETVWAVPFEPNSRTVAGIAVPVLDGVGTSGGSRTILISVSISGTLVYSPSNAVSEVHRVCRRASSVS